MWSKTRLSSRCQTRVRCTQNRAAGTTARPSAYFTNNGQPVYGTVSLVVDGNTVYTSPGKLFDKGQTPVRQEWNYDRPEGHLEWNIFHYLALWSQVYL
jgi:hypothetical protein